MDGAADEDVDTTAAQDTATAAAAPSARRRTPMPSSTPLPGRMITGERMHSTASTPREAMHDDEIARTRLFAKMALVVMVPMVVGLIIGGGDPTAKAVVIGGFSMMAVAVGWLIWVTRNPARYTQRLVAIAALSGFVAVLTGIHYWGVLSPAAAVLLFGIYFFSLGENRALVYTLFFLGAGGHAVLAALVMSRAIPDLGVIKSTGGVLRDQVVSIFVIELLYIAALRFGRHSRKATITAVERLEQAVRAVSVREALLAEARQELDRQLKIGGPGRYSEQVIGSFKLGNLLGRGGMGEVYEAINVKDQRPAAVKLLHPSSLGDDAALGRFLREAAVTAKLHSPHVAAVLEVGTTAGEIPYIAMERLAGDDLARTLRKVRRLSPPDVIALVRQAAAALNEAHAAGIVHRDLKPSNLFLADGPTPTWKVLDFGVSKVAGHGGTLTAGRVVGTPGYMAPEQARGEDVDKRADTFSLAAIAYRCLTGHPPFTGKDTPSTLYEVASKMPTQPSQLQDDLSRDVDRVLAIGLAKDPRHRFPDATALADALVAAIGEKLPEDLRRVGELRIAAHPWGARVH